MQVDTFTAQYAAMEILSPVTGMHPTTIEKTLEIAKIVKLYEEEGIEVSRFFDGLDEVQIRRCEATGYRFYYPFSIFGDDPFYSELQAEMSGYYVPERWEHTKAQTLIGSDDRVLEIGSGSGAFLKVLRTRNIHSEGLELNTLAAEKCVREGLLVHKKLSHEFLKEAPRPFTVVCSFQVLEHISNVKGYCEDALRLLAPGGKLIVCVPNNNPYLFKHDIYHTLNLPPHHAGLWGREAFEALPKFFGMQLNEIWIEPLQEYRTWFQVQQKTLEQKHSPLASVYKYMPRPVYKAVLRMLRNRIEGRNIMAMFTKN